MRSIRRNSIACLLAALAGVSACDWAKEPACLAFPDQPGCVRHSPVFGPAIIGSGACASSMTTWVGVQGRDLALVLSPPGIPHLLGCEYDAQAMDVGPLSGPDMTSDMGTLSDGVLCGITGSYDQGPICYVPLSGKNPQLWACDLSAESTCLKHGDLKDLPAQALQMGADPSGDLVVLGWNTSVFAQTVAVGVGVNASTLALEPAITFTCSPGVACPMGAGDLNGDHLSDLVIVDANNQVYIFLQDGQGSLVLDPRRTASATQAASAGLGMTSAIALTVADLDMDGLPELVLLLAQSPAQLARVALRSDGTFVGLPNVPLAQAIAGPLAIGDLNGDGTPDLASLLGGSHSLVVFLNHPM